MNLLSESLKGKYFEELLNSFFIGHGFSQSNAIFFNAAIDFLIILLLAALADWITKTIIIRIIKGFVRKSKTTWDDVLFEKKVFNRLSHLAPAMVINALIPLPLAAYPKAILLIQTATGVYMVVVITMVITSLLNALEEIYNNSQAAKQRSIRGYVQAAKIIIYFLSVLVCFSVIFHKDLLVLFTGLGAVAAIITLIFKDSIMGLVGGIQLSANDLLRIGDWIEMPKYNIDGTVIEMNLTTVKIRNSNNTVSTIPTYTMVNESFTNWRPMEESGGRRIRRSLKIDMRSVTFCDNRMLDKFRKMKLILPYIEQKQKEIDEHNEKLGLTGEELRLNGRQLTNLGVLRVYLEEYVKHNPNINTELKIVIRHLQPVESGIPIEINCFSLQKEWLEYEKVQADIFDHLLAILPEFELKVFQNPMGEDFAQYKS